MNINTTNTTNSSCETYKELVDYIYSLATIHTWAVKNLTQNHSSTSSAIGVSFMGFNELVRDLMPSNPRGFLVHEAAVKTSEVCVALFDFFFDPVQIKNYSIQMSSLLFDKDPAKREYYDKEIKDTLLAVDNFSWDKKTSSHNLGVIGEYLSFCDKEKSDALFSQIIQLYSLVWMMRGAREANLRIKELMENQKIRSILVQKSAFKFKNYYSVSRGFGCREFYKLMIKEARESFLLTGDNNKLQENLNIASSFFNLFNEKKLIKEFNATSWIGVSVGEVARCVEQEVLSLLDTNAQNLTDDTKHISRSASEQRGSENSGQDTDQKTHKQKLAQFKNAITQYHLQLEIEAKSRGLDVKSDRENLLTNFSNVKATTYSNLSDVKELNKWLINKREYVRCLLEIGGDYITSLHNKQVITHGYVKWAQASARELARVATKAAKKSANGEGVEVNYDHEQEKREIKACILHCREMLLLQSKCERKTYNNNLLLAQTLVDSLSKNMCSTSTDFMFNETEVLQILVECFEDTQLVHGAIEKVVKENQKTASPDLSPTVKLSHVLVPRVRSKKISEEKLQALLGNWLIRSSLNQSAKKGESLEQLGEAEVLKKDVRKYKI